MSSKKKGERKTSYCQTRLSESAHTNHEPRRAREDCKAMDAFAPEFLLWLGGVSTTKFVSGGVEIPLVNCSLAKEERMA
jgi:hypothetical protein